MPIFQPGGSGSNPFGSAIDVNELADALLVTSLETILANDNDITVPTCAAVIDYVALFAGGSGASVALDNLAGVAINAALVLATNDAFALGSASKSWSDLFLASGAVINFNNGDVTLTHSADTLTLAGGVFAVPAAGLTVGGAAPYLVGGTDVSLADGGTGASLVDPAANTLMGWDDTDNAVKFLTIGTGLSYDHATHTLSASGGGGATTALDNLASVAINAALVLATSDAFALGSTTKMWSDLFLASGAVVNFNNGNITLTHAAGLLTLAGGYFVAPNINLATGGGLRTSTSAGNTFLLQAYDVDGAAYTTFATLTANNTPTMALASAVTAVTQSANDNSTKIATTAYADNAGAGASGLIATISVANFDAAGRYTTQQTGAGAAVSFGTSGVDLYVDVAPSSYALIQWQPAQNGNAMLGDPVVGWRISPNWLQSDFTMRFVSGFPGSDTDTHSGFKLTRTGSGTITLSATQADGVTEATSSLSTAVVEGDDLELIMCPHGSGSLTSIDYYYRINGGALNGPTTLSTHLPTGGNDGLLNAYVSNNAVAIEAECNVYSMSYYRP
jgi:hypothetical protein